MPQSQNASVRQFPFAPFSKRALRGRHYYEFRRHGQRIWFRTLSDHLINCGSET
jgi:hypothetical protein